MTFVAVSNVTNNHMARLTRVREQLWDFKICRNPVSPDARESPKTLGLPSKIGGNGRGQGISRWGGGYKGWAERVGVPGEGKKVFDWKNRRVSFAFNSFNSRWIVCKDNFTTKWLYCSSSSYSKCKFT